MLLNFDLAQIAEDYVSEFCDLSRTGSENENQERTQTDKCIQEHGKIRRKKKVEQR